MWSPTHNLKRAPNPTLLWTSMENHQSLGSAPNQEPGSLSLFFQRDLGDVPSPGCSFLQSRPGSARLSPPWVPGSPGDLGQIFLRWPVGLHIYDYAQN